MALSLEIGREKKMGWMLSFLKNLTSQQTRIIHSPSHILMTPGRNILSPVLFLIASVCGQLTLPSSLLTDKMTP